MFTFSVKAQQPHFIYLQTDNGEPFYVKLNNQVISSSAQGYVIVSNITDGEYQIAVGFPKKEHPEEIFSLNIDNNNEGFVIKNFDGKGMQLFNFETLALISANSNAAQTPVVSGKKDTDAFSTMLANVVKDSSILQNHQMQATSTVVAKTDASNLIKTDSSVTAKTNSSDVVKNDSPAIAKVETSTVANKTATAIIPASESGSAVKDDSVKKILSNENNAGLTMLYSERTANQTDTVSVFIPSPNAQPETENNVVAENKNPVISSSTVKDKSAAESSDNKEKDSISSSTASTNYTITPTAVKQPKDSTGFVFRKDSVAINPSNTQPVQVFTIGPVDKHEKKVEEKEEKKNEEKNNNQEVAKAPKAEVVLLPKVVTYSNNSDCKAFATNEDFLRLRKKIASENTPEDMIRAAGKYFRSKCYSTEQIKDLSYLFLTEEGKYMFFDAAYAHTSDSDQYETLESQFTDPYYLNRFKAMLRK